MTTIVQSLRTYTRPFGQLARPVRSARNAVRSSLAYGRFVRNFARFRSLAEHHVERLPVRWADRYPCLHDRTTKTPFDRHYTFHTAWAARAIAAVRPTMHVDIASSLYFATIVSAFVPVRFYDYRPADLALDGLTSEHADLTDLVWPDRSVASLSCMHVVEHVGLGRYGDPLDPDGDAKAMRELARVVAPGGSLLFVVPVGRPRVCYNAHRVYGYGQVRAGFPGLALRQFALVPDRARDGGLIIDADPALVERQKYGCGCFWLEKSK